MSMLDLLNPFNRKPTKRKAPKEKAPPARKNEKYNDQQMIETAGYILEGKSNREIASITGVNISTVNNWRQGSNNRFNRLNNWSSDRVV